MKMWSPAALAATLALGTLGLAPAPLQELAQAERDFARHSVEKGMRVAFDAHFADDGINFNPHPVKTRENLAKRGLTKPPFTLDWFPSFSDVSASGEFGFNTGPWTLTDESEKKLPPQHGYFFSIWRRVKGEPWKVLVDLGIDVPAPLPTETAESWRGARHEAYLAKAPVAIEAEREGLKRREGDLQHDIAAKGLAAAYAGSVAGDFRFYRDNTLPIVDLKALRERLTQEQAGGLLAWEPTALDVAAAADFGYSWGGFTRTGKDPVEKGYYVHAWRRDARGAWQLVFEILKPLPPEAPAK